MSNLVDRLVLSLGCGNKGQQIYNISVFKTFMHNYICEEAQIESQLIPKAKALVDVLWKNRGRDGIRVSAILSLLVPLKYHNLARAMVIYLLYRLK